jgi:hypothetical protein
MIEQIAANWGIPDWLLKVVLIGAFFLLAYGVHRLRDRLAAYVVWVGRLTKRGPVLRPERQATLTSLVASGISIGGFALALLLSLSLFVSATTAARYLPSSLVASQSHDGSFADLEERGH